MILHDFRPLLAVAIPLLACILIQFLHRWPNLREACSVAAAVGAALVTVSMAGGVQQANEYEYTLCNLTDTLQLTLRVDAAGLLFACVSSILYIAVSIYAIGYMRRHHEQNQTGFYSFFALCICSALGIAFSANLLTFFVFFEILTIATWPLVFHARTDEAKFSGRKYLIYTLIPGQLFLAGIVILYGMTGQDLAFVPGGFLTLSMGTPGQLVLLFFLLIGAGMVKAGMMPLHGWLPSAMVAPTPVSALLHAVAVVKAGAFCILRITGYVYGPELLREIGAEKILAWIAGITIITSSVIALRQDNLKRRLAFSTIGQLSYIVLGCCMLTENGYAGALYHIVAHALMKITLFMAAGAIIVTTHKENIRQMHGIGRRMPVTIICFTIASLGVIGLPFTVGFVSKWKLALGALQSGHPVYLILLLISAMLGLLYLLPITYYAFFCKDTNGDFTAYGEADKRMLCPILATTALSVLLGILPNFGLKLFDLANLAAASILH